MGKRRDERRAAERAAAQTVSEALSGPPVATDDVRVFETVAEGTFAGGDPDAQPSTVVVTEVDREAGTVTAESVPESVEERPRGVVRFADSVRLWDVTFGRLGQVTEARTEDFEILVMPLGVGVRGHGCDLFVPWANVRSLDCAGVVEVVQMMSRHYAEIG